MKKKCRVFTICLGWSEAMFIFDGDTSFTDIKNNPRTNILTKENYIGTYEFDKKFINFYESAKIGDKRYFYRFSYHKDNITTEEKQWKRIPEVNIPETKKSFEHKNVDIKPGESDAGESLF